MTNIFTLWKINDALTISFGFDTVSKVFLISTIVLWLAAGVYSTFYMKGEKNLKRYYAYYIAVFLVMVGMAVSANFFTYYLNYELMTLLSAPLVMHEQTKEARLAGFKYLIYSLFGAYLVLFGFFVLNNYCQTLTFKEGGTLDMSKMSGHEGLILLAVFLMILGFGVKAGMWPMHAWLTTAHPLAVSPASAVLSGVIVKAGVTGIIRVVYFLTGMGFIRGTWVQHAWAILSLVTVLMGSTLAFYEKVLKKRLAYSTISQVSYILFGLSMLNNAGYFGAMLQFLAHAFAKCALFLAAGALIIVSGSKKVDDLRGIGKKYPVLLWCFTFASLSMVGIPPTGGYIAKFFLIEGALLDTALPVVRIVGPIILLVSALLTAGYLFPITMRGFLPGKDFVLDETKEYKKLPATCIVPIIVLTVLALLVGIIPDTFLGGAF